MFSDKEKMMRDANYYAKLVASAKKDCADTFVQMITQISEIERNWKGDSGTKMSQISLTVPGFEKWFPSL